MLRRIPIIMMMIMAVLITSALITPAIGETWQMKQRDMHNTGRADYLVPENRMNDTLFDFFLWQKPAAGPISSTSMSFYDGMGPGGADIVVGGYHWPKGVQGMDRHTGAQFWAGNPDGGENIGKITPAFSNDGSTIYVTNDATPSPTHPLMAFGTVVGPSIIWDNRADSDPDHLGSFSPTIAPDGSIFLHQTGNRPYGGTDTETEITETWAATTALNAGNGDPALYQDDTTLMVIIGGLANRINAYDGTTDINNELWSVDVGARIEASVTIDPANGNIYVGAGENDIYVVGLDKSGTALWTSAALLVYDYEEGTNNPQKASSTGCLSHDGSAYYFQTISEQGDGCLYAISTTDGSVKWTYNTNSECWSTWKEFHSSPIVTQNGVIIIGNNDGDTYYALKDDGNHTSLIDTLAVDADGKARASATISQDGRLYLPVRTYWTVGNGDGETPTYEVKNLFTAMDITDDPTMPDLLPPRGVIAVALNSAVSVSWLAIPVPAGLFDQYAVYRDTTEFTSVEGMTPIGTVSDINTTDYLDETAVNGSSYYYAVTTVDIGGGEITDVTAVGPRTPWDETDLQVVSISRTPRYPRYAPTYTYYEITEPSGFGPYIFSAATGLGQGQTGETQRWPEISDPVTYTATVRNRGTNNWDASLAGTWRVDGAIADQQSQTLVLEPGDTTTFTYVLNWDGQSHEVKFTINETDDRSENNSLAIDTKSVPYLSYIDISYIEDFREETSGYPDAVTDDFIDWVNRHMARFNEMFEEASCQKRVHYDLLEVLNDNDDDPDIDRQPFAVFPFRFYAGDPTYRESGYYRPEEDIDYGYLHEMGHQLGLIDLYQLDVPADRNHVSGEGYNAPNGLMRTCAGFISEHSALAMNHWLDEAHGYYGQYMYNIPSEMRLKLLDYKGDPLVGATVKMYQYCERPGQGKVITDQVKAQGVTGAGGEYVLPNVVIDQVKVPPIYTGDELHDNPFGYLAVVGTNGVLLFRVEYQEAVDYVWLDITEANIAYFNGQTGLAIFERQLGIGGPPQYCPPEELTELNAIDWAAWAQGSSPENTYVEDDTGRKVVGDTSLKFVTDGGFDTYVRYPRTFTAHWDLSSVNSLKISFYAENPNIGFQNGSPWIRLKDANNNYFEYQYYHNGSPSDLLNEARNTWKSYEIPLDASPTEENGWRRTTVGSPDFSHMQYVEIHADTWGFGFTLWIDGVGFDPSPPCPCECDLSHDGKCDMEDWLLFGQDWGRTDCHEPEVECECDLNDDGRCDMQDWLLFGEDWGRTDCPIYPQS